MDKLFFDNWQGVVRTLVVGVLAYATLVLLLRISGKRTLAKMNAFDLIVTVALGSSLATILLNKDVSLAEGSTALVVLIGMQYAVAWLSVRCHWFESLVKSEPAMLFHDGRFLWGALRRHRVTRSEILAAIRAQKFAGVGDVQAVVLETDGTFSVIARSPSQPPSSLQEVKVPSDEAESPNP